MKIELDEQYLAQNYLTARLLMRKYKCLRTCILLFFVALFVSFTVFLGGDEVTLSLVIQA